MVLEEREKLDTETKSRILAVMYPISTPRWVVIPEPGDRGQKPESVACGAGQTLEGQMRTWCLGSSGAQKEMVAAAVCPGPMYRPPAAGSAGGSGLPVPAPLWELPSVTRATLPKFTAAASNDWWTKGVDDSGLAPPLW